MLRSPQAGDNDAINSRPLAPTTSCFDWCSSDTEQPGPAAHFCQAYTVADDGNGAGERAAAIESVDWLLGMLPNRSPFLIVWAEIREAVFRLITHRAHRPAIAAIRIAGRQFSSAWATSALIIRR